MRLKLSNKGRAIDKNWQDSPVEFAQKMAQPRKNSYKDILYTVGKVISSAFQWGLLSFFYRWGKNLWPKTSQGVKIKIMIKNLT